MRILVLAPHPFYLDRGTPIDLDILLRALASRGDRVDVVCYPEGEPRSYAGVRIHRPKGFKWLSGSKPGFSFKKIVLDFLMLGTILRLMRGEKYDVIHAGEEAVFVAAAFGRLFGVPYVYDMDSSIAQQLVEQLPWLKALAPVFNGLEAWVLRRCLAAAPVCNALADLARSQGAPFVETLHDISQLENPGREPVGLFKSNWGVERPALVYVGNFQPYQGVDLLLEAFGIAVGLGCGLDLVVAGGRPDELEPHRSKASTFGVGDRVHFIGPWPADRLDELLAEAEILVSPRTKGVNTPQKIFPYLHSGKPVLATQIPTHTQVLEPGVAMFADPRPRPFAEAILRLEEDPALRGSLGRAGQRLVEENHLFEAHQGRVQRLYGYVESRIQVHP